MTQERTRRWLRFASATVIGFGLLTALGAHPTTGRAVIFLADLLLWPLDGAETGDAGETRLIAAIAGGVMAGWGWMLWGLTGEGMDRAPELSRRLILGSVALWFLIDSTGSLAAGAPLNILGNLVFLAMFLWPLRRPIRLAPA